MVYLWCIFTRDKDIKLLKSNLLQFSDSRIRFLSESRMGDEIVNVGRVVSGSGEEGTDVRHENLTAKLDLVLKNIGLAVPVSDVCTPLADMKAALPLSVRLTIMEEDPPRPFFALIVLQ
ncbi:MAG: hypothetical protein IJQ93_06455 [Bacteroidales bacterium]|nr:hypothetical protein [Bacteroidales bacterium]